LDFKRQTEKNSSQIGGDLTIKVRITRDREPYSKGDEVRLSDEQATLAVKDGWGEIMEAAPRETR